MNLDIADLEIAFRDSSCAQFTVLAVPELNLASGARAHHLGQT